MILPNDEELTFHENNGGVKTPLNGLKMMHDNLIDRKCNEPSAWDAVGLYFTLWPAEGPFMQII